MKVTLMRYPTTDDWYEVKRRALVTVGKTEFEPPTDEWKHKILEARHSPIRYLMFSFYIECPYWVSTHLARHIHAQPYIKSQRNDRQSEYDRNAARQDAPVQMIFDCNAEELMVIANKRLCNKAAKETRELVKEMCALVEDKCHEFELLLVPMCIYQGGVCHEMNSCMDEYKPIFGMCFDCKKNDSGFSGGFEENFDCPYQDEENGTCWEAYKEVK